MPAPAPSKQTAIVALDHARLVPMIRASSKIETPAASAQVAKDAGRLDDPGGLDRRTPLALGGSCRG
jgi:hypothetical protein